MTVLTAVSAGLAATPYSWAHVAVIGLTAAAGSLAAGSGVATIATQRAMVKAQSTFWQEGTPKS